MKNRRIVLVAFMLVSVCLMGIGFAAYSTTLSINGTTAVSAEAVEFTEDVQFTAATSSNEAFGRASVAGQTASFTVDGMTAYNDRVQFTYTITNNSNFDVNIDITTHPTPASPSKCTVTTALSSNVIAKQGGTITATVTVVLNENVTQSIDPISWTIEYTATSVDVTP